MLLFNHLKMMLGQSVEIINTQLDISTLRRFQKSIQDHHENLYSPNFIPGTCIRALFQFELLFQKINIDPYSWMHAEEEYEYFQPIDVMNPFNITHQIVDVYEKSGAKGQLVFLVIESRVHRSKSNDLLLKARRVLVELKT